MLSADASLQVTRAARNLRNFSRFVAGVDLFPYQTAPAREIIRSVFARDGRSFVIMFSRQSGKDEMLANLFLYLLARFFEIGCSLVCAQPTFKPQTINAMDRLLTRGSPFSTMLRRSAGYIIRFHKAKISYFSADPAANVVGATADRLLVINEAQDVLPAVYDKRFAPMAASGNATRVFSGTAWTSNTLLERERKLAQAAQDKDGLRRIFIVDCATVGKSNPHYANYVKAEIAKLGRMHPLIRTQYFNELIDEQAGMFTPGRLALMQGDQPAQEAPIPGRVYAFLLDAAGQDESRLHLDEAELSHPGRDACSLSIAEIDTSSMYALRAPTYRIIHRHQWIGINHLVIFGALKSLADAWKPAHLVIDATGVGEGLWALLDKAYPNRVLPVKFTQAEKSEIGWRFIAIIETGRFRDCCHTDEVHAQYTNCSSEILPGPAKTLRWGVPDGTRGTDGELIHDDHLTADALTSVLDRLEWVVQMPTNIITSPEPKPSISERTF